MSLDSTLVYEFLSYVFLQMLPLEIAALFFHNSRLQSVSFFFVPFLS